MDIQSISGGCGITENDSEDDSDYINENPLISKRHHSMINILLNTKIHTNIMSLAPLSSINIIAIRDVKIDDLHFYLVLSDKSNVYKINNEDSVFIEKMIDKLELYNAYDTVFILNKNLDCIARVVMWCGILEGLEKYITFTYLGFNEVSHFWNESRCIKKKVEKLYRCCYLHRKEILEYKNRYITNDIASTMVSGVTSNLSNEKIELKKEYQYILDSFIVASEYHFSDEYFSDIKNKIKNSPSVIDIESIFKLWYGDSNTIKIIAILSKMDNRNERLTHYFLTDDYKIYYNSHGESDDTYVNRKYTDYFRYKNSYIVNDALSIFGELTIKWDFKFDFEYIDF